MSRIGNKHFDDLSKLFCIVEEEGSKRYSSFSDLFMKKDKTYGRSALKKVYRTPYLFETAYFGSLVALAFVVIWKPVSQYIWLSISTLFVGVLVVIELWLVRKYPYTYPKKVKD